jgi:hypothetical protein
MGHCHSKESAAIPTQAETPVKSLIRFGIIFSAKNPRMYSRIKWNEYLMNITQDALKVKTKQPLCKDVSVKIIKKEKEFKAIIQWSSFDCDVQTVSNSVIKDTLENIDKSILRYGIMPEYVFVDMEKN